MSFAQMLLRANVTQSPEVMKKLPKAKEMPKFLQQRLSPRHLHQTTFEILKHLEQTIF
jgi:hypothetical protein